MNPYPIEKLSELFREHANPEKAFLMKKYMKDQFQFYGIQAGPRRELSRAFLKMAGVPSKKELSTCVRNLWEKDQREYQFFAMELMAKFKKQFEKDDLDLIQWLVTHKSWWDTVDFIATNLAGSFFLKFPDQRYEVCQNWLDSGNIWLQRTSILFQLKYKKETDLTLLTRQIMALKKEKEFFIAKAIGWALREYSKTDPHWAREFVKRVQLMPLSEREALKWMINKGIF